MKAPFTKKAKEYFTGNTKDKKIVKTVDLNSGVFALETTKRRIINSIIMCKSKSQLKKLIKSITL